MAVVMIWSSACACSPARAAGTVEEWPVKKIPEPSGIVYHPTRKTLFVVGDEGDIGELDLDGHVLRSRAIGGDLEGITCDPASGLLYVVREGQEIIFELRPEDFKVLRRFTIDRTFGDNPNFLERGGDGVEGITFVPDAGHPEGGRFFAVNQFDPPVLVELAVPLRSAQEPFERATIVAAHPVSSPPLSGVLWDAPSQRFLIISALWRSVHVVDARGHTEKSVRIPGIMQEGIARLPDGTFVIVQDTGGLIKWKPDSDPFPHEEGHPDATTKSDSPSEVSTPR
jgi:uncharacterized protein YjiK